MADKVAAAIVIINTFFLKLFISAYFASRENAARTLEYAYDDWCIYRMGEKLGRPAEELDVYKKRSQNYRNLFDPETKLMRGKNSDGTFQTPFNPFKWGDAFTEGNSLL